MTNPTSTVLLVAICSNHKTVGGDGNYEPGNAVRQVIAHDPNAARDLYEGRRAVRTLLTGGSVARDGRLVRKFPLAKDLVDGPDFHRSPQRQGGAYLPAIERYNGGFYKGIGPDKRSLFDLPRHHVLILSGLYGLLTPLEPIQSYSCHVSDHPDIAATWTGEDRLTRAVLAYIKHFRITKVFDFTADNAYRSLLSWERIRHATGGNVLHCFSEQYAGAALLPSLGALTRKFLASPESALLGMQAKHREPVPEDLPVVFERFPMPESPDIAVEIRRQETRLTVADKVGRMRRNINAILSAMLGSDTSFGFGNQVTYLEQQGRLDDGAVRLLRDFGALRNAIEYKGRVVSDNEWPGVKRDYEQFKDWAWSSGHARGVHLQDIE